MQALLCKAYLAVQLLGQLLALGQGQAVMRVLSMPATSLLNQTKRTHQQVMLLALTLSI